MNNAQKYFLTAGFIVILGISLFPPVFIQNEGMDNAEQQRRFILMPRIYTVYLHYFKDSKGEQVSIYHSNVSGKEIEDLKQYGLVSYKEPEPKMAYVKYDFMKLFLELFVATMMTFGVVFVIGKWKH